MVSVSVEGYVGWWTSLLNCFLFIAMMEGLLVGRLVARSAAG